MKTHDYPSLVEGGISLSGKSRKEFAAICGISGPRLSQIINGLNGKNSPARDKIREHTVQNLTSFVTEIVTGGDGDPKEIRETFITMKSAVEQYFDEAAQQHFGG